MLRHSHMFLAYLTVVGFALRLFWSATEHQLSQAKAVRIAPHVIDTALLVIGVIMALRLGISPVSGWLGAKLAGLVAYIGFGVLAMRGRGAVRWLGAIGAFASVGYIFAVATTRQVMPL
ncbi:MAG: SirB2 family protein [Pseudomonadaceae bacterium]|nr:SirB2 family protein [Pseudomonadaceae bacterium]